MAGNVNVTGIAELRTRLDAMLPAVKAASRKAVLTGEALLVREAMSAFTQANPGKITPSPAPPGSAPAVVTGTLRRSITMRPPIPIGVGYSGLVYPAGPVYARIQELGGVTGRNHATTLPPRPYLKPALDRVRPLFYEAAKTAWTAALTG